MLLCIWPPSWEARLKQNLYGEPRASISGRNSDECHSRASSAGGRQSWFLLRGTVPTSATWCSRCCVKETAGVRGEITTGWRQSWKPRSGPRTSCSQAMLAHSWTTAFQCGGQTSPCATASSALCGCEGSATPQTTVGCCQDPLGTEEWTWHRTPTFGLSAAQRTTSGGTTRGRLL